MEITRTPERSSSIRDGKPPASTSDAVQQTVSSSNAPTSKRMKTQSLVVELNVLAIVATALAQSAEAIVAELRVPNALHTTWALDPPQHGAPSPQLPNPDSRLEWSLRRPSNLARTQPLLAQVLCL